MGNYQRLVSTVSSPRTYIVKDCRVTYSVLLVMHDDFLERNKCTRVLRASLVNLTIVFSN